jgi:hypothetical protein
MRAAEPAVILTAARFMPEHERVDENSEGPDSYNYAYFDRHVAAGADSEDEAAFRASFRAGERAEDFALVRLDDGAQVNLSHLWRSRPLVMEFGSFT